MKTSIRWENVDLKAAGLSRKELAKVVAELKARLDREGPLRAAQLKKAIKQANSLLNAKRERNGGIKIKVAYNSDEPIGRFGGGQGATTFVPGGAPNSKR
ncbi:hypothetical protein SFHH103_03072 [Sinorhizobium fredii HH103]|uniref:Uncharacterized protein n=1 Tax=Sinorhizobium fredii (strain HH103) TaxID=1117943 RepID=G9A1I4_SINF1|nr:hypothetical protein [Sinorhizobium fredii]CCE97564.1 hypothetical protein SFHH103_03072 [Sinorhizobium fredii HH103]